MDTALVGYEQRRDALTRNGFELTLHTARLAPLSARLESFYRAAAMRPELTRRIFGVIGGSRPRRLLGLGYLRSARTRPACLTLR